ncbi:MAG: 16S rRNA (guanine(527)-N(7))-methyltransferase RsmG [Phycisphaeraceae bacterium]|nr:16S rRNA (guanine(527)-N(7))-methyltransferase RsmG [Phycisphaeraceae bacterium]
MTQDAAAGSSIPTFVPQELEQLGIAISAEELAALGAYLAALLEANEKFNLTGVRDLEQAWRRHVIDSLTLLALMEDWPAGSAVIDVGSGGGLPGIPLAITKPQFTFALLEATGKKARFLEECCQKLNLTHVKVITDRAEKAGQNPAYRQRYDAAVARGVGQLNELLEYTLPLVKVGGQVLAMKGPSVESELEKVGDALVELGGGEIDVVPAYPEGFGVDTVIVRVTKARPTPKRYPRLPGVPGQAPL